MLQMETKALFRLSNWMPAKMWEFQMSNLVVESKMWTYESTNLNQNVFHSHWKQRDLCVSLFLWKEVWAETSDSFIK